jgi:hypothetical protein
MPESNGIDMPPTKAHITQDIRTMEWSKVQVDLPSSALLGGQAEYSQGNVISNEASFSVMPLFLETLQRAALNAKTVSLHAGRSQSSADIPLGNFIFIAVD